MEDLEALPGEVEQPTVPADQVPVHPADFVVLAIGVVVALLGPAHLVAPEHHPDTLGEHQGGDEVPLHPLPLPADPGIVGGTLRPPVPAVVLVGPVPTALAVPLLVLLLLAD